MCPPNAVTMACTVVREVFGHMVCHHFASFEAVRIHTGVTVTRLKVCLTYSGTLGGCFLQTG